MIWRVAAVIVALALLYAFGQVAWRVSFGQAPAPIAASDLPSAAATSVLPPALAVAQSPNPPRIETSVPVIAPVLAATAPSPCQPAPAFNAAAQQNAATLQTASWSVFGRPESGWEIYEPLTAQEIGTACPAQAPGFAQALSAWQGMHGLPPDGIMDSPTLMGLKLIWLRRRPFVAATAHGACPPAPAPDQLAPASPDEGYQTKPIQLRPGALEAYRAMVMAARAEQPAVAGDKRLLTIFSGYRDPVSDAANCARDGNCGTVAKANCSAHRTGTAMDVYLGSAAGFAPESSADPNRLYQSRSPAYRWLVANAGRFGFVNYPFEPWHWEWTGAAP
jgi:D-alanyl-D-alanine carboxypeptidase